LPGTAGNGSPRYQQKQLNKAERLLQVAGPGGLLPRLQRSLHAGDGTVQISS